MKLFNRLLLDPVAPAGGNGNPPAAPAAPAAPATPPEGFVSRTEFTAALEAARQQEKEKLYAETTRLTGLVTAHETTIAQLNGQLASLKSATSQDGKTVDIAALIADVSKRTEEAMKATFEPRIRELSVQVENTSKQLQGAQLERTKARLIKEAGGEDVMIPAMIAGNTEAELAASIATSKATFEGIKQRVAPGAPTLQPGNGNGSPTPTGNVPPPVLPNGAPAGNGGTPTVKEMSLGDFAAKRKEMLAQTAQRYSV